MAAILGKKIGMTQVFGEDGGIVDVTAIEAGPCSVLAVGAKNIQLGFDSIRPASVKKPLAGYFNKLNISPKKFIKEVPAEANREYKIGEEIKLDLFKAGDFVDITGTSKGKGFQGGMKRWNWKGGPMTHGSTSHRRVGSIGSTTTPGRVFKGHHMAGHMGNCRVTLQNLEVVKVDIENNLLLVKGAVPGYRDCYLIIKTAKKKKPKVKPQQEAAGKKAKK